MCPWASWFKEILQDERDSVRFDYPPLQLAWFLYWQSLSDHTGAPPFIQEAPNLFGKILEALVSMANAVKMKGWDDTLLVSQEIQVNGSSTLVFRYGEEFGWFDEGKGEYLVCGVEEVKMAYDEDDPFDAKCYSVGENEFDRNVRFLLF